MGDQDGSLVVTFNGEIYNYLELRDELTRLGATFQTSSDTEVLLHGYRQWGAELPSKLIGMFAFAIADRKRNEIFFARDRFGEKPLFVFETPHYFAFSSELRPLAALPELTRELDLDALGAYLCLNYVPGVATLMKNVRRLAPGHWMKVRSGSVTSHRYWSPGAVEDFSKLSLEEALQEWRQRFDQAVRICLRSDVPVGIFLSGGIDSSLIAESAQRHGNLARGFCLDFSETSHSEYPHASHVAEKLGIPLDRVVLTPAALADFFRLVEHADDPLADSSALAVWALARHAASKVKVVLGGDGGDELFGGYLTYRATALKRRYVSLLPGPLRRYLAKLGRALPVSEGKVTLSFKLRRFLRASDIPTCQAHYSWNGSWLPEEAARFFQDPSHAAIAAQALGELCKRVGPEEPFSLLQMQLADIAEYLPNDILAKADRMTMAHGLELRAPMLNHSLAGFALGLPTEYKITGSGRTKYLLRRAAGRIYGEEFAALPKQGFSIPIHKWVREDLAETIRDLLSKESIKRVGALKPDVVDRAVVDHFAGRRSYGFELWGLAVFVAWHRARIERTLPHPPDDPLVERTISLS